MRTLFAGICFALLLCGASAAGFSALLLQNSGPLSLTNGANSLIAGGATWTTSGRGGFTDGQFQADGGYIVPVQGIYHFDATVQVEVTSVGAPNQMVDIRIVKCANGCNSLCTGTNNVAETLIQGGELYLGDGFDYAQAPTISLSVAFTGYFNTGDIIGICVDSSATSGAVKLICPNTEQVCAFSAISA